MMTPDAPDDGDLGKYLLRMVSGDTYKCSGALFLWLPQHLLQGVHEGGVKDDYQRELCSSFAMNCAGGDN